MAEQFDTDDITAAGGWTVGGGAQFQSGRNIRTTSQISACSQWVTGRLACLCCAESSDRN